MLLLHFFGLVNKTKYDYAIKLWIKKCFHLFFNFKACNMCYNDCMSHP